MSYRSVKRVLGESSLELKCLLLFGICLAVLIFGSFCFPYFHSAKLVQKQNRIMGRLLANQAMCIEHWTGTRGNAQDSSQQFAEVVEELAKDFKKQEHEHHYILPYYTHGGVEPRDEFERALVDRFIKERPAKKADGAPEFAERILPERNEYRYYQPFRVTSTVCLACHAPTPAGNGTSGGGDVAVNRQFRGDGSYVEVGDLAGIVEVSIPYQPTQDALTDSMAGLSGMAIITAFLAVVASYLIIRYVIVKPLRHLRDVSDAISHGNTSLRAEIHTGDEFESLGQAFNRMLRHLVAVQDELRHVNTDLDGKVDELARANMRLYEMNRIKSDFLATMSHELRTPLNSILGFSDVLQAIDALDEKQKRYVQNIQKSGRMLLDMINDILDLAKIESGKMDVRLTDFRVEQVIGAQCDMARPLTERKNIDLEIQVQPDLPALHQDQARVQQILNNLLSNAIKFTPEGGRIKVAARRDEYDHLMLQTIDTGVGIAEEDQHAIFEKFRQGSTAMPAGDAMTREYSGTGLGLSIVKELCRLLHGEVFVESVLGKGSTFTVRLPWRLDDQPPLDSPASRELAEFTKARFEFPRTEPETAAVSSAAGAPAADRP